MLGVKEINEIRIFDFRQMVFLSQHLGMFLLGIILKGRLENFLLVFIQFLRKTFLKTEKVILILQLGKI